MVGLNRKWDRLDEVIIDKPILVTDGEMIAIGVFRLIEGIKAIEYLSSQCKNGPTHWMPLPRLPQPEDEKRERVRVTVRKWKKERVNVYKTQKARYVERATDGYLRGIIAKKWKCKKEDIPQNVVDLYRPVLKLKREIRKKRNA